MVTAERIRDMGFRRWYERQLVHSHLHLITGVLLMILAFTSFEVLRVRGLEPLIVLFVAAAAAYCWRAFRKYLDMLQIAEILSNRASCPQCHAYARFHVEAIGDCMFEREPPEGVPESWLKVRCKKCDHGWQM